MGMRWSGWALPADELARFRAAPETLFESWPYDGPGTAELDKAWHGIQWLLTGEAWGGPDPLGLAVFGGDDVFPGGEEMLRMVDPDGVRAVHQALSQLTDAELAGRFDATAMSAAELYPDIWDEPDVLAEYLLPWLTELRALYAYAAGRGFAVLQMIG